MADDTNSWPTIDSPIPTIAFKLGMLVGLTDVAPTIDISSSYTLGEANLVLPLPEIYIIGDFRPIAISAPAPEIYIRTIYGTYNLRLEVPPPTLAIASYYTRGELSVTLPAPEVTLSGGTGTMDSLSVVVTAPEITLVDATPIWGTLNMTDYLPVLVISGYQSDIGEATEVTGLKARTHWAVVINTDIWAVSEYTNFDFDYLVKFGDVYLGVAASGIYTLGGEDDDDVNIDSVVELPLDDFGTIYSKRLSYLGVGIQSDGDMEVGVIMNGDPLEEYPYDIPTTNDIPRAERIKIGKGIVQRKYVNLKFKNIDGCDFNIRDVHMDISTAVRSIDGI